MRTEFRSEKLNNTDPLEKARTNIMALIWILKKYGKMIRNGFIWSRILTSGELLWTLQKMAWNLWAPEQTVSFSIALKQSVHLSHTRVSLQQSQQKFEILRQGNSPVPIALAPCPNTANSWNISACSLRHQTVKFQQHTQEKGIHK